MAKNRVGRERERETWKLGQAEERNWRRGNESWWTDGSSKRKRQEAGRSERRKLGRCFFKTDGNPKPRT